MKSVRAFFAVIGFVALAGEVAKVATRRDREDHARYVNRLQATASAELDLYENTWGKRP